MLVATGCVGARIGESWAAIGTAFFNGEEKIVVTYNDYAALVEPNTGTTVRLLNAEGEVRLDEDGNPRRWVVQGGDYEGAQFFAVPIQLDEESLLFPAFPERLIDIDVVTARLETSRTTPTQVISNIALDDSRYYLPDKNGGVDAIDRESFDVVWSISTEEGVWAQPTLVDGTLYFGSINHVLYAVNAETGEIEWEIDTGGAIAASPTVVDDHIYVGNFVNKLFDVSTDGEILAEYETENWIWGSPVVMDNVLYIADLNGIVYALDRSNNLSELWTTPVASGGIRPSPLVTDRFVIVATRDGKIFWLDRQNGSPLFDREIEGAPEVLSDILLVEPSETIDIPEPIVVVSTVDFGKLLVAYTLENGRASWVYGR